MPVHPPHAPPPPAQGNLFAGGPVAVDEAARWERVDLGGGAWVDLAQHWLGGADNLAARLIGAVGWQHHRRWMYDRQVDEPRLSRWYRSDDPLPDEALAWFRVAVGRHYGVRFGAMGLNYYRDGRDSVAFHSDRELRHLDDTLVAIVTVGAERSFLLRPTGGGRSIDLRPASGDLLVMGGTCQQTWEHGVPKTAAAPGPRVSASVRWARATGAEQEWAPPDRARRRPGPDASQGQMPARARRQPGPDAGQDQTPARIRRRPGEWSGGEDAGGGDAVLGGRPGREGRP